jgi:hypothetical protein
MNPSLRINNLTLQGFFSTIRAHFIFCALRKDHFTPETVFAHMVSVTICGASHRISGCGKK